MTSYRFYASSLLIIYDGAWAMNEHNSKIIKEEKKPVEMDLRMIDFAHCTSKAHLLRSPGFIPSPENADEEYEVVPFPPTTNGPDGGYLRGLRTLIRSFEEIHQQFKPDSVHENVLGNDTSASHSLGDVDREQEPRHYTVTSTTPLDIAKMNLVSDLGTFSHSNNDNNNNQNLGSSSSSNNNTNNSHYYSTDNDSHNHPIFSSSVPISSGLKTMFPKLPEEES